MLQDIRQRMFGRTEQLRIGRFQLHEPLGEGGQGSVFEAYDEQLARGVALKVLNPAMLGADPERASRRLLREAQALAQLSHPNVVQVYDSGRQDERVWVAMELVRGASLRAWIRDAGARSAANWLEVFDLLQQAGRGLVAAHEIGIIHRDFKPDNILVGDDGRVRVADFGLARATMEGNAETAEHVLEPEDGRSGGSLTRTGQILGTPRYMAPEQFDGVTTKACDQFAFSVTAWEALTGRYPFRGQTPTELLVSFTEHVIDETTAAHLPRRVRQALTRGMSPDPSARHPSVIGLLEALGNPRGTRARRRVAVLVGAGLACAVVIGNVASTQASCDRGRGIVSDVWGPTQRTEIESAFRATELAFAQSAAARTVESLESRAGRWAELYDETCRIHTGDEESSDHALKARCLRERLAEIKAVTVVLGEADATTVGNAVQVLQTANDPAVCSDLLALREEARQFAGGAEERPDAEPFREKLKVVEARIAAGQLEPAKAEMDALLKEAKAVGDARILTAVENTAGVVWAHLDPKTAVEHFLEAFRYALAAGDTKTGALAAVGLARQFGYSEGDVARGRQWIAFARSLNERLPVAALEEDIRVLEGHLLRREGRFGEALEALEATLSLPELPPDRRTQVLEASAQMQLYLGRYRESVETFDALLALSRSTFGEDHGNYATTLSAAAVADMQVGNAERSRARAQAAVAKLTTSQLGLDSALAGVAILDAGLVEAWVGDHEAALELLARAESNLRGSVDESTGLLADVQVHSAIALYAAGELDEALARLDRAEQELEAIYGGDVPVMSYVHSARGEVLFALGRYDEAEEEFRRSRKGNEADGAVGEMAVDDLNLGSVLVAQGKLDPGETLIVEALEDIEDRGFGLHLGLAYWRLGQLRLAQGRFDEAVEQLERALEASPRAGVPRPAVRADLDRARARDRQADVGE